MPVTALNHFQQDIARSRAIVIHSSLMAQSSSFERLLRSDFLRSGIMFAVGALDAYFSDAYTDIVAATIISKNRHNPFNLPEFFYEIRFPIRSILESYANNPNWRWRMAARKMMERDNVLKLSTIQTLFNKFFRVGQRFFGDLLSQWIAHPQAHRRFFGISPTRFSALATKERAQAVRAARDWMESRFQRIFERRHDCIHNCDRPKVAPQPLVNPNIVLAIIADVEFLVLRCDEHINVEFRQFLLDSNCPPAIVAQVGY